MSLDYIEVTCQTAQPDGNEWVIATLSHEGFEAFAEDNGSLKAYIPAKEFTARKSELESLLSSHKAIRNWQAETIAAQNWNEQWEKNYQPVRIDDKLLIRAPFHHVKPENKVAIELIIEPKMSFGTGHHATTRLMTTRILETDLRGKSVLDMGCGTGILAILASKRGAASIIAIDNDPWACINAVENCERNLISNVEVVEGEVGKLESRSFDFILANINKNVLIADMQSYSRMMSPGGGLIISGFFEKDLPDINIEALRHGFGFEGFERDGKWAVAWYIRGANRNLPLKLSELPELT